MADLFSELLKRHPPGGLDARPVMETISDHGLARSTDPTTSHIAANSVNATKGEAIVLDTLADHGPMTMEEVGEIHGKPSDHLGPRFASLIDKRMIVLVRNSDGTPKTKPGKSKRPRQIYKIQPDKSLWRKRPKRISAKARVNELEAGLREIRQMASAQSVGFVVQKIDQLLEQDQ